MKLLLNYNFYSKYIYFYHFKYRITHLKRELLNIMSEQTHVNYVFKIQCYFEKPHGLCDP